MRSLILLVITLLCAVNALRRPVFGVCAFVGYSVLAPHAFVWGVGRSFSHAQLIAIATILGLCFSAKHVKCFRQPEAVLLLLLWAMFCFTTLFAMSPESASARLFYVSKILLMVFISLALINTEAQLHTLLLVIALTLGFHGVRGGVFALRTAGQGMVVGPDDTFLMANNSIGLALVMNTPLLYYLAKVETRRWLRHLMHAMRFLSYPAILCSFSRGAWLGLAAISASLLWRSRNKLVTWSAVAMFVLISPLWWSAVVSDRVVSRYDALQHYEDDQSAQSRFWSWEFCRRVGAARPLNGGGFDYYSPEAYAKFYPEFLERWPGKVWSCHSIWLTVFGEHGVVTFFLWTGLLASCLMSLGRLRARAAAMSDMQKFVFYAEMLQLALVGYLISGTFVDAAYFDIYYQLIGVVILLKAQMAEHLAVVDQPTSTPGLLATPAATALPVHSS